MNVPASDMLLATPLRRGYLRSLLADRAICRTTCACTRHAMHIVA
jgi:hypothetical protein